MPPIELMLFFGFMVLVVGLWILYESQFETKYTNERDEDGEVVDLSYKAYESDTSVNPTFVGGKVGFSVSTTSTPERHMVVIRGSKEVRKVIIDDEEFYDSVKEGKTVKLELQDKHKVKKGERPNQNNYVSTQVIAIVVDKKRLEPNVEEIKFS